jgi:hypothetical protein
MSALLSTSGSDDALEILASFQSGTLQKLESVAYGQGSEGRMSTIWRDRMTFRKALVKIVHFYRA